jgi:V/A-type H+/Na+-transporting ATPase subunit F
MYAIGAPDVVGPFKAVGAAVLPGATADEVKASLQKVFTDKNAFMCMITEDAAALAPEELTALRESMGPAVLVIPGHRGSSGKPYAEIRQMVARAVGVDLMAGLDKEKK